MDSRKCQTATVTPAEPGDYLVYLALKALVASTVAAVDRPRLFDAISITDEEDTVENENIDKAIAAHGAWKERLVNAIASGSSDFDPEVVKLPDRCEFGKWLYGSDISAGAKEGDYYAKAVDLHARFHVEASKILALALEGKKAEAEGLMSDDSEFTKLSSTLTDLLNDWKKCC